MPWNFKGPYNVTWDKRNTPATQPGFVDALAVKWEDVIDLGNELKKDIWINIFYNDDDYVFNLATMLRDNLDHNVHVYVEFANEAWY
jgi:hypothetical protein